MCFGQEHARVHIVVFALDIVEGLNAKTLRKQEFISARARLLVPQCRGDARKN
jgi:hypothetical protein